MLHRRAAANRKSDGPAVKWLKELLKALDESARPYVDEVALMKASTIGWTTWINREDREVIWLR